MSHPENDEIPKGKDRIPTSNLFRCEPLVFWNVVVHQNEPRKEVKKTYDSYFPL